MRHSLLILSLLLASFSATADNYLTIGYSDTVLIHPLLLGNAYTFDVRTNFDGRLDYWHLTMDYPNGLSFIQADTLSGMRIPYVDRWGQDTVHRAELVVLQGGDVIMSTITENGYWDSDGDGNYDTYGTVKWEAGDYPMFKLTLGINNSFRNDTLKIIGLLTSTHDWRGGNINPEVEFTRNIIIHIGYHRGDLNGDGALTTSDVTTLINYTMSHDGLDEFQLEAADVNRDGTVNISDVSTLINLILANGGTVDLNQFDFGEET